MTSIPEEHPRNRRPSAGAVWALCLVSALTLGAFVLRIDSLGLQSFWFDEAMSVVLASRPITELMALVVTEDIHPPLYLLLLHFWMALAGDGEFAARFFSVIPGIAIVPLMYVTGKRLAIMANAESPSAPGVAGLVGALLAASSAFYVSYSQEARNYMLVTALGLLSSYLLLRALPSSARRPWLLYALTTVAALYTNYTAFLLVVFHAVFVALGRSAHPGSARRWLKWAALVALIYAPWLGYAISQLQRINDYWPGTLLMDTAVQNTLSQLVAGSGANARTTMLPVALAVALLALGALVLVAGASRRHRPLHSLFLLLYLVVPTIILFGIAYSRPKFDPRYLLVATPAFYLTLAWGVAAMLRAASRPLPIVLRVLLPVVGIAALAGTTALSTVYGEPTKMKADYRGLVSYTEGHAQPGDAVVTLMSAPHPYIYYSTQGIPWYPMERVDNFDGAIIRLNRMTEEHRRLWFILWQKEWEDPDDYVMHMMEGQSTEVPLDASFTGLGLRLFEVSPNHKFKYFGEPPIQHPIEATFGNTLEFWGWNSSRPDVQAGGTLDLDVHWIPHSAIQQELKEVFKLVDAEHHVWAKTDEVMGNPLYPTTKWKAEEVIHDRHTLKVPAGTPPGQYSIELSVYDPRTLKELSITRSSGAGIGTSLSLGAVTVRPPAALLSQSARVPLASWYLGGTTVDLTGSKLSHFEAVPGEPVELTVQWRLAQQSGTDFSVRIAVQDSTGRTVATQTARPAGTFPPSRWLPGEEITGKYWLVLPVDLAKERYWVLASPVVGESQTAPDLQYAQLGHLDILSPDARYELPPMQTSLGAQLGGKAELAGFDLGSTQVRPGATIRLTLYWRALGAFDKSYKVFNHVIDERNVFAGQRDAVPESDTRPTTTWRLGEVLVDRYEIPIAPDARPGSYKLKVGMYAQEGGDRLQVTTADGKAEGDSITLATIEVAP